jgi:hypothetical protein
MLMMSCIGKRRPPLYLLPILVKERPHHSGFRKIVVQAVFEISPLVAVKLASLQHSTHVTMQQSGTSSFFKFPRSGVNTTRVLCCAQLIRYSAGKLGPIKHWSPFRSRCLYRYCAYTVAFCISGPERFDTMTSSGSYHEEVFSCPTEPTSQKERQ